MQMILLRVWIKWMIRPFAVAVAGFIVMSALSAAVAAPPTADGHKTFASPQEAVNALIIAVRNDNNAELLAIFGPGSEDLISSGDPVADKNGRARFLKAYGDKNSLEQEGDAQAVFHVGTRDYVLPIPLVREGSVWFFDTRAGMEEILDRRIGRNELHTIEVLHAYTDAQREYACMNRNDGAIPEFAQKLTSSPGKKNGLYWEAKEGEEESPFGPLIARATQEGYLAGLDEEDPEPFHGYYFKILKAQGEHADGGAFDYVVDGKMILGFGLVAYPAKYGASGIMTFMVNQEGVIYEKDLDEDTPKAAAMTMFDPDDTWKISEGVPEEEGQDIERSGVK
jgi:hypothetical protein